MDDQTRPEAAYPIPTFDEWWAEYTVMRVAVRPSTLRRDESIFRRHLAPAFGAIPIDKIGFRQAQRFVADLTGAGLAPRTVAKAAGLLSQSLEVAVRSGLLSRNPARRLVLVGAYAGLRHGELAALRVGRIDIEASTIDVVATRTMGSDGTPTFGPPKSRAGRRTVPVPRFVMNELATHIEQRGLAPGDLMWTSADGSLLVEANFRARIWRPATVAAGLEGLRVHDLRHTCIAMWSRSLASPRAAAKWAGHANPSLVLTVYGGVFDDESAAVMDRLSTYASSDAEAESWSTD